MGFISFIGPLLSLFFVNTLVVKWTNRKFGDSFPITIISLPLIILVSHYIFRNLIFGVYLIYVIVIVSIILFILNSKNNDYREKVFSVGFAAYIFIYLFIYIVTRGVYYYAWDEFVHWGPSISQIVTTNKMYSGLSHAAYPPFAQLFEYTLIRLGLYFEEYNVKFALHFFNFAIFCVPISERFAEESNKKISFIKFAMLFLTSLLLAIGIDSYNSFRTIYIDTTVAMFFAYLIYLIIFDENKYLLPLSAFAFMTLKDISVLFIGLVLVYVFVYFIYEEIKEEDKKKIAIKYLQTIFYIFVPALVAYLLWHFYKISVSLTNDQFALDRFSIASFFEIFTGKIDGERLEGYNNFIKAIFNTNISRSIIPFTYFVSFVVIEIILGIFTYISKVEKKIEKFLTFSAFVIISYLTYMLFMMNMYVNIFNGTERIGLASYARYMSSFVLGIYLISLIYIYKNFKYRKILFIIYFILSIVLSSIFLSYLFNPKINQSLLLDPLQNERKAYKTLNDTLNDEERCLVVIDYMFYTEVVRDYYNKVGSLIDLYDIKNFQDENNIKTFLDSLDNYKYIYVVDNNNRVLEPLVTMSNDYIKKYNGYQYDFTKIIGNKIIDIR